MIADKKVDGGYRYGFNGKEKDDEITGVSGTHYTAEYWMYDSRIGRRWNIDPKFYLAPGWFPYSVLGNNPNYYIDPFGDKIKPTSDKEEAKKDINSFVDKLNKGQEGIVYSLENDLIVLDKKNSTVKEEDYNEFTKIVLGAIDSKQTFDLKLVRGKENIFYDGYLTGEVDLDDFDNTDERAQSAFIGHFLYERTVTPNYEKNKGKYANTKKFGEFHKEALIIETKILSQSLGVSGLSTRKPYDFKVGGNSNGYSYGAFTYSYGQGVLINFKTNYEINNGRYQERGDLQKATLTVPKKK